MSTGRLSLSKLFFQVLIATITFLHNAQAASCVHEHGNLNAPIHVIFVNGIQNSPAAACESNTKLYNDAVAQTNFINLGGQAYSFFIYNNKGAQQSSSNWYRRIISSVVPDLVSDVAELNVQAAISDGALNAASINSDNRTGDLYLYYLGKHYAGQFAVNKQNTETITAVYGPAYKLQQAIMRSLDAGKKVLLVSHSQGNFVTEAAYAYLVYTGKGNLLRQNVRIVSVAPVSYSSPPSLPPSNFGGRYMRINLDNAIRLFASAQRLLSNFFAPLSININVAPRNLVCLTSFTDYFDCVQYHSFTSVYMSQTDKDTGSGLSLSTTLKTHLDDSLFELLPNVTAPVAAFTPSASSVQINQPVSFNPAASTAPFGQIINYAWNFGDNQIQSTLSATTVSHTYAAAGMYTVSLTVTDNLNQTKSTTQTITVTAAPPPPVAAFTANPGSAQINQTVSFDPSASNAPAGQIVSYAWDFGDGQTSASSTAVTHSYSAAGNYTVRLTVTDNLSRTGTITQTIVVTTSPPVTLNLLNDTGITASQCYQAGSDALVSCSSAGALTLNNQQDGMLGRDANPATNSNTDGKLGFSYTKVCNNGDLAGSGTCPANPSVGNASNNWGCTKDNLTGLMWENKSGSARFSNFDDRYYGTTAQMYASTNTYGYVATVNVTGFCGHRDWRMPTVDELQSIVDYGAYPLASIDAAWFPNTPAYYYWTSSPDLSNNGAGWYVNFTSGNSGSDGRYAIDHHVRLVR